MTDVAVDLEAAQAQAELERRMACERTRYYAPNGRLEEALHKLDGRLASGQLKLDGTKDAETTILIIRGGNHCGKTALATALMSYLCDRVPNEYFDAVPYLRNFPKRIRARLATTANAAAKTYPEEIPKWFPAGKVKVDQAGRRFDAEFEFQRSGSNLDILTFDQDPQASESMTLNLLLIDEPLPQRHWTGLKSRFRHGGLIIFVMTALEGSGWVADLLETQERIGVDVFSIEVDSEDNCKQHGVRGVIEHAALVAMERDYDESELQSRRHGKYLHMGSIIYGNYRDGYEVEGKLVGHEPKALEGYYRRCYDENRFTLYNIVDPHDLKPFAVGWYAVFPNGKVFTIAEWPDESMAPFHKIKRWAWSIERYANMMMMTEKAIMRAGKPSDIVLPRIVRLMDPNFGPAPKLGGKSALELFEDVGRKLKYPFRYELGGDSIAGGHLAVKTLLGDPANGAPPSFFTLPHCKNHRYGFTHYGVKENKDPSKGQSETPELVIKDFMDLVRYGALWGFRYLPPIEEDELQEFFKPRVHANGYRGL